MSVTGLKSFESLYCVSKSPKRSDRKFCWMFCLVLGNSLTIKSLLFGSVIFRNDNFLLAIFYFFSNMVLNMVLNMVSNMVSNIVLNMVSNMVLSMVFNMVLNTNSVGTSILFPQSNSLASVSILPVFKAHLTF